MTSTPVLIIHSLNGCGYCKKLLEPKAFEALKRQIYEIEPKTEIIVITHDAWNKMKDQHKYINLGYITSAPTMVIVPKEHAGPNGNPKEARIWGGSVSFKSDSTPLKIEMQRGGREDMITWLKRELKLPPVARTETSPAIPSATPAPVASSSTTTGPTRTRQSRTNTRLRRSKPYRTDKNENDKCTSFRRVGI